MKPGALGGCDTSALGGGGSSGLWCPGGGSGVSSCALRGCGTGAPSCGGTDYWPGGDGIVALYRS